jgi:phage terminase large subunit-like protein
VIKFEKGDIELYPLGRDSKTLDGLNVGAGVCDEYHAHPNNELWEVVESSQGARREPMMLAITTAGFNAASPAYSMYEYAKKVLDEVVEDDDFFAFVAEAKKKDGLEWLLEEETWREANPNYGVSLKIDYIKRAAAKAYRDTAKLNNFLVKHLNIWTSAAENYFSLAKWRECQGDMVSCVDNIIGFDYSLIDDFTAIVKIGYMDGRYYLRPQFYIPEDHILERERELRAPLLSWVKQGYIIATPGENIDEEYISNDLETELLDTKYFAYDPYRAKRLVKKIENEFGFDGCISIRQGFITLSEPTKWLSELINSKRLVHDGNPVMTWMITNAVVITDVNGNIMISKKDPNRKVDGVAATINALAILVHQKEQNKSSVYESRGIRSV